MVAPLGKIAWDKFEVAVPAFLTMIMMPLTYSIATGIAIGFIFYPITMVCKGKAKGSSNHVRAVCRIYPVLYLLKIRNEKPAALAAGFC